MVRWRELLLGPLLALEFLTILRLRKPAIHDHATLARSQAWFPAVGLALGAILFAVAEGLEGPLPAAPLGWLLVGLLLLLTGGLHVDGLGDTADGLHGGDRPEERLRIMRDGSVGPMGAAWIVVILALKATTIASLAAYWLEALIIAPALARWGVVLVIAGAPYPRSEGLGRAFHEESRGWPLIVATVTAGLTAILLTGPAGFLPLLVTLLLAAVIVLVANRSLGGATGDVYGATVELCEVAILLALAVMASETVGILD